jgi:threonine/homoserine/homoserine lactone efflux protein
MEFYAFIASVVLISLSGVLAPGPVFAAAIAEGRTNRYAGFHITAGHAVVEIPLIMALAAFGTLAATENLRTAVSLAGGAVLLYLAYDTATTCPSKECRSGIYAYHRRPGLWCRGARGIRDRARGV